MYSRLIVEQSIVQHTDSMLLVLITGKLLGGNFLRLLLEQRKGNHVPDGGGVCEQHYKPIDTDTESPTWNFVGTLNKFDFMSCFDL